jgi:hypothetical protein
VLGIAVAQLRLNDYRQDRLARGLVRDEDHDVGQVLHRHDRAHVRRRQGYRYLSRQRDASGALDEFQGDLGVLANQIQRPLMRN